MSPGDRVDLIIKLTQTLSSRSWREIDLILETFSLPTSDTWKGDEESYCQVNLKHGTDHVLLALDDYLHGSTAPTPDDAPWGTGRFRLFLSHLATHMSEATDLRDALARRGIEAFVAHVDIKPTMPWQKHIEAALQTCDALAALLHDGFRESDWCDQEVGFVLGRNVPAIAIRIDMQPYGLFGARQSLDGRRLGAFALADEITKTLLREPRVGLSIVDALVDALVESLSADQSNGIMALLAHEAPLITQPQADRIRQAQATNGEVQAASGVESGLRSIMEKFDLRDPATIDPNEPPL